MKRQHARERLVFLDDDDSVVFGNALRADGVGDHGQSGGERFEHLDLRAAAAHRREQQDRGVAHEGRAGRHFTLDLHTVASAKTEPVHTATGDSERGVRHLTAKERPDSIHETVRRGGRHRPATSTDKTHDRACAADGQLVMLGIEDEWDNGDVGAGARST